MSNTQSNLQSNSNTSNIVWQILSRLITSGIVLAITAFFTPSFSINSFWTLSTAAVVLTLLDYIISKFTRSTFKFIW